MDPTYLPSQLRCMITRRIDAGVMTSDENGPSARSGYRDGLHNLLAEITAAIRAA
ncbi:hypothetical protein J2857_000480 [Neorhizobium galegae]|uniref:hypothetical protein n=1 Tax=Neorhizobium galegae TaxID=399 RepID=UPI001AE1FA9B|nr:hypothetical protein [Neorhizobium galegae]MBP2557729.1 hypothetical protein [Neorhizobium galegae]